MDEEKGVPAVLLTPNNITTAPMDDDEPMIIPRATSSNMVAQYQDVALNASVLSNSRRSISSSSSSGSQSAKRKKQL